eukprot:366130-Chlamydomonas_euryale.AAC.61
MSRLKLHHAAGQSYDAIVMLKLVSAFSLSGRFRNGWRPTPMSFAENAWCGEGPPGREVTLGFPSPPPHLRTVQGCETLVHRSSRDGNPSQRATIAKHALILLDLLFKRCDRFSTLGQSHRLHLGREVRTAVTCSPERSCRPSQVRVLDART